MLYINFIIVCSSLSEYPGIREFAIRTKCVRLMYIVSNHLNILGSRSLREAIAEDIIYSDINLYNILSEYPGIREFAIRTKCVRLMYIVSNHLNILGSRSLREAIAEDIIYSYIDLYFTQLF